MRPFAHTISVADALVRLLETARPVTRTERVPLEQAAGRVCGEAVHASSDVPPFDRAAMDGYAVLSSDTAACTEQDPVLLRPVGVTYTGEAPRAAILRGECVEIATGAPLPGGADAVVMVERTRRTPAGLVEVQERVRAGQNVGRRGNDVCQGARLVDEGDYLTPARVGVLAAAGVPAVVVRQRPRVVVASTGNEVVAPAESLGPGQIHDVNRYTLPPVITAHGGEAHALPTVADDIRAIEAAFEQAADADLVIFTGGSSVGDRDLVVDAVRTRGQVIFHGVAMKPGKPTLFAHLTRDSAGAGRAAAGPQLFLGLSGNPTSCLSNAYVLLVPLLRRLAGLPDWHPQRVTAPLDRDIVANAGRHLFYPVRIDAGRVVGVFKGSGEITSLSEALGYIEIPADVDRVSAGTPVTVTMF
jgi:molybdenum cofactor synthesis domain-containing protein